jgi:hypothetical protein
MSDYMHGNAEAEASALSRELRLSTNRYLRNRRVVAGLSLFSSASIGMVALYQMGIIKHLPNPPVPTLDSDKVAASDEAYRILRTPDAFLALGSYAVTAFLAARGPSDRVRTSPLTPVAMAGKALFDAALAAGLVHYQWVRYRAFCVYCLASAGATIAAVPFAIPEAWAAVRRTWDRSAQDMGQSASGSSSLPSYSKEPVRCEARVNHW